MLGSSLTTTTILATTTVLITILATQPSANADPQPTMPLPSPEGCGLVFVLGDGGIRREEVRGGTQDMGGPAWWTPAARAPLLSRGMCASSFSLD